MKKRLYFFVAAVLVLLISSTLLVRFAPLGRTAEKTFMHQTGPVQVSAAEKLSLKQETDIRVTEITAVTDETARCTRVEALLLEYGRTGNALLLPELMNNGLYLLAQPQASAVNTDHAAKNGVDISVLSPCVFYDGYTKEWIVLCGGWWNSDRWESCFAGDLGERNCFGVTCVGKHEAYSSHVSYAAAGLWSDDETIYKLTPNRSGGDGAGSFEFELQDYITITGLFDRHYIGERWAGFCRFAPGYENYDTELTAYYTCD